MVHEDEQIESLGKFLKREREKRGVSLEEISTVTKVGLSLLKALEADQHGKLPSPPFVVGYIKAFANHIDRDPQEFLARYRLFLKGAGKRNEASFAPSATMNDLSSGSYARPLRFAYWIGFAAIVFAVIFLARQISQNSFTTDDIIPYEEASTESAKVEADYEGENSLTSQDGAVEPTGAVSQRLLIHTTKPVWMKVKLDGHPIFKQQLLTQRDVSLNARQNIQVYFSDRSAVRLTLNEKPVTDLGKGNLPIFLEFNQ